MAKALEQSYDKRQYDLVMIARTETTRNENAAKLEVFDTAQNQGIEFVKIWNAARDRRTRPAHRALDDTPADGKGLFYATYKGVRYSAPAPCQFGIGALDINCRCTVTAELLDYQDTPQDMTYDEWLKNNNLQIVENKLQKILD
jgi:uncharacterized protein with gpF-like domain